MMEKHNVSDSYLRALYSDKQKAHRFVKALFGTIGINLRTTKKRVYVGGSRQYVCNLEFTSYDFTLMLCQKKKYADKLFSLMPALLHSDNLSDLDKDFVKEGVDLFNEAKWNTSSTETPTITELPGRQQQLLWVTRRHSYERELERITASEAGQQETDNEQDEYAQSDQEAMLLATERAEAYEHEGRRRADEREARYAKMQEIDSDDDDITIDEEDNVITNGPVLGNVFIDDCAVSV